MAVHGVSRATADVDLLTLDTRTLTTSFWQFGAVNDVSLRGAVQLQFSIFRP